MAKIKVYGRIEKLDGRTLVRLNINNEKSAFHDFDENERVCVTIESFEDGTKN